MQSGCARPAKHQGHEFGMPPLITCMSERGNAEVALRRCAAAPKKAGSADLALRRLLGWFSRTGRQARVLCAAAAGSRDHSRTGESGGRAEYPVHFLDELRDVPFHRPQTRGIEAYDDGGPGQRDHQGWQQSADVPGDQQGNTGRERTQGDQAPDSCDHRYHRSYSRMQPDPSGKRCPSSGSWFQPDVQPRRETIPSGRVLESGYPDPGWTNFTPETRIAAPGVP